MRWLWTVAVLALVCTAGACGGLSAGGLSGKSASQVLALARAAASREGSYHFIDQSESSGKATDRLVGDSSNSNGQQELSGPYGLIEVERVGTTIYVRGSEASIETPLELSQKLAAAAAGKWVSLVPGDAPYETISKALLPSAELDGYIPTGKLEVGSLSQVRGHTVLAVSGSAPAVTGASGVATLYVSTTAPYVPVGGSLVGAGSQKKETEAVAFTAWGEKVVTKAPTGARRYTSLLKS